MWGPECPENTFGEEKEKHKLQGLQRDHPDPVLSPGNLQLPKPSPGWGMKRNKENKWLGLCFCSVLKDLWGLGGTSGPWSRNSICEAARCEDSASGQHLPAETEPR